jgi:toxin-antitoxin system PIN domain toxin
MSYLLDINVLVASAWNVHSDHGKVKSWMMRNTAGFATAPPTQIAFLRVSMSMAVGASFPAALTALQSLTSDAAHRFVSDEVEAASLPEVQGHKEVHDAHLVMLARRHGLKLATLDRPLSQKPWAADVVEFIG